MRDAILVRKGAGVKASNPKSGNFATHAVSRCSAVLSTVNFTRGWVAVDAKVRGKKFHFVNTHLESESNGTIREDQAAELVAPGVRPVGPSTVLVGDLNSDPARRSESPTCLQQAGGGGFETSPSGGSRRVTPAAGSSRAAGVTGDCSTNPSDRATVADRSHPHQQPRSRRRVAQADRQVRQWSVDLGPRWCVDRLKGKKRLARVNAEVTRSPRPGGGFVVLGARFPGARPGARRRSS